MIIIGALFWPNAIDCVYVCNADWVMASMCLSVSECVWARITNHYLSSNLKQWYLSAPQRYRCSHTHTQRKHNMDCESALRLCAYHRYWQGGTLAGCRAQALCPSRLIVRPRIERAGKEKWLHPSLYFPHLRRPLDCTLTRCGKQWEEGERELEGQRDFKLATKITASRLSPLPGQCVPFFSLFPSQSLEISQYLWHLYLQQFCSTKRDGHDMKERKGRRARILRWSWMSDCVVCAFCPLNLQDIVIPILSQPSVIRRGEVWAGHRSWWQVSQRVLVESAAWKQTSLPVQLGIEPQYLLRTIWNVSVAILMQP